MMSMVSGIQGQPLEVTIVGCSKLKDTEWISRQDPYVCIEYATTKFRTRTCTDGGKHPVFQEKTIIPLIEGLREILVTVWNSNTLTFDDFIGTGRVQLQKVLSQGYDDSSWSIQSKSGKYAGEVKLIMHFPNTHVQRPASYAPSAPSYMGAPPLGYPPSKSVPVNPPSAGFPPSKPKVDSYAPPHVGYPQLKPVGTDPPHSYPHPVEAYPPRASSVSYPTASPYPSPNPAAPYPLTSSSAYPTMSNYPPAASSAYPTVSSYPPQQQTYPPPSYPPPQTYPPPPQAESYYPPGPYPGIYPPPPQY